jgi:PAS domain S-box-containing protein
VQTLDANGAGRILWLDDRAELHTSLLDALREARHEVIVSSEREQVLALVRAVEPAVVMAPLGVGRGLLHTLGADATLRDRPVIVFAESAAQLAAVSGWDVEPDDFLVEPIAPRELLLRLAQAIRSAAQRADAERCERELRATIEAQKAGEAELRETAQRLEQIARAMHEAYWIASAPDFRVLYMSPAHERISGIPVEKLYESAEVWMSALHPEDREWVLQATQALLEPNGSFDAEYRMLRPDGSVYWLHSRAFPILKDGRVYRIAGVAADVTERKHAERVRLDLERQLRQAQKLEAVGTLAGGIAHDFNNILGTVVGNAELLRDQLPATSVASQGVEQILVASRLGRELVERLLSFARPQDVELQTIAVAPVVEQALLLLRPTLPAGIELTLRAQPELPEIHADAALLHQIVVNVVNNAVHALEGRIGRIQLSLDACQVDETLCHIQPTLQPGPHVRLTVRDNGVGIDPAILGRIFEPFFTTKRPGHGTGLGLATVHGIVRGLGGAIVVESELNVGSSFALYLPSSVARSTLAREMPKASPTLQGQGRLVLIVDDEASLVQVFVRRLEMMGFRTQGYVKAADAIAAFRASPQSFDLVITDHSMPVMSGVQLAKTLLEIRPDIPIALCSGFMREGEVEHAEAVGIREILAKPFSVEQLSPMLQRLLG